MKNSATKPKLRLKKPQQVITKKSFANLKQKKRLMYDNQILYILVTALTAGMILAIIYRLIF